MTTTEFKISIIETGDEGNSKTTSMNVTDFLSMLYNSTTPKTIEAKQDCYPKSGDTVYALAGEQGLTVFLPKPVEGEFIPLEIKREKGSGSVYIKVKDSKDTMVGDSTVYEIKEEGTSVSVVSHGYNYVTF